MPSESPYRSTLRPEDFAPQKGFNLSIVSLIVFVAGIAVHFFKLGGKERITLLGGPTMWVVIGGYVVIFMTALVISFFAFAGTRSRGVSTLFFCLSVPALIFGAMKVFGLADDKIKPDTTKLANVPPAVGLPTPTPPPKPVAPPANIPGNPTYSGGLRQQYIRTANDAFVSRRDGKINAFKEAFASLQTAGGVAAKGLASKEAIAERRKLVATLTQANDDYMAFTTNQEANYRAELQKTPLVPNDVDDTVNRFMAISGDIANKMAVRETEKQLLQANDDVLAMMEMSYGRWKLQGDRAVFQKKSDINEYIGLLGKFNAAAAAQAAAQKKLTAAGESSAPAAPPDAAAPGAAATPPAASQDKTPAPAPAATPAASPSASLATPGSPIGAAVTPIGTPQSAVVPTP